MDQLRYFEQTKIGVRVEAMVTPRLDAIDEAALAGCRQLLPLGVDLFPHLLIRVEILNPLFIRWRTNEPLVTCGIFAFTAASMPTTSGSTIALRTKLILGGSLREHQPGRRNKSDKIGIGP